MKKYKTLDEIREDLDKGIEIFWSNKSYKVHYVDAFSSCNPFSLKDDKVIRVTCISNYFGGLIDPTEISSCFSETKEKPYVSSIINKYGDYDKVPKDCKKVYEIYDRQGASLLIDCIAEKAGAAALKYNLTETDRKNLIEHLVTELKNALQERL